MPKYLVMPFKLLININTIFYRCLVYQCLQYEFITFINKNIHLKHSSTVLEISIRN